MNDYLEQWHIPPAPRRFGITGTIIAWIVILIAVTLIITRPNWLGHRPGFENENPSPPPIDQTPSTQLQMVSRVAMGAKALAPDQPINKAFVSQIDETVTNPIDEFRSIIVIDEILGDQAALNRLNQFEKKYQVIRLREDADALRILYKDGLDHLSDHQKNLLVSRHQWFGKLAVSHCLPPEDPRRQAALKPAQIAVVAMSLGAFAAIGLLILGVVLLILAIVWLATGRFRRTYQPAPKELASPLVEAFALYLAGMLCFSLLAGWLFPQAPFWINFFIIGLLPLVLIYLRLRGLTWNEIQTTLGLYHGRGFLREIFAGIVGYVAGLPLLAIGAIVTFMLMKISGTKSTHPIINQPINSATDIVQLFLLACVVAPIIEETLFRGALLGHLRARLNWWISAPIVSLIFAAIHPQGWPAIPVLGSIAMTLAAVREWRGSLIASMTTHACNNAVAVLALVLMAG